MAGIYYNLVIDCGADESLAARLEHAFEGWVLNVLDRPVPCSAQREHHRNIFFVRVTPIGMGYRTEPREHARPDLVPHASLVRDALYEQLKTHLGFRRALFGAEAYDWLATGGDTALDNAADCTDMVYQTAQFKLPADVKTAAFAPAYAWVTEVK